MKSKLRTFVAVPANDEVKRKTSRLIKKLELEISRVRWTDNDNYHCTLAFLGEMENIELPAVCDAVQEAAAQTEPFEVAWSGIGAFPNLTRPRVLWVGTTEGGENMTQLAHQVEAGLIPIGYRPPHRGFTPHLTLGRGPRHGRPLDDLRDVIEHWPRQDIGRQHVDHVNVYSSDLTSNGPVYTVLARVPLGN